LNDEEVKLKIREIIKEHVFSSAVPDFVLTQALDKTTADLRSALLRYVYMYQSTNSSQRAQGEDAVDRFIEAFKVEVKNVFEDCLQDFLNDVR